MDANGDKMVDFPEFLTKFMVGGQGGSWSLRLAGVTCSLPLGGKCLGLPRPACSPVEASFSISLSCNIMHLQHACIVSMHCQHACIISIHYQHACIIMQYHASPACLCCWGRAFGAG